MILNLGFDTIAYSSGAVALVPDPAFLSSTARPFRPPPPSSGREEQSFSVPAVSAAMQHQTPGEEAVDQHASPGRGPTGDASTEEVEDVDDPPVDDYRKERAAQQDIKDKTGIPLHLRTLDFFPSQCLRDMTVELHFCKTRPLSNEGDLQTNSSSSLDRGRRGAASTSEGVTSPPCPSADVAQPAGSPDGRSSRRGGSSLLSTEYSPQKEILYSTTGFAFVVTAPLGGMRRKMGGGEDLQWSLELNHRKLTVVGIFTSSSSDELVCGRTSKRRHHDVVLHSGGGVRWTV